MSLIEACLDTIRSGRFPSSSRYVLTALLQYYYAVYADMASVSHCQCLVPHSDESKFPKTRLLTIWFGANDACLPFHFQHVPLEKYADNLRQFIHMVSHPDSAWYSPETKIILITPPPINSHQWRANLEARDPPLQMDRQFDVTAAYAQAVRDVGKEKNVLVVDAFQALWDVAGHEEQGLSKYLSDGLHLTVDGYEVSDVLN